MDDAKILALLMQRVELEKEAQDCIDRGFVGADRLADGAQGLELRNGTREVTRAPLHLLEQPRVLDGDQGWCRRRVGGESEVALSPA
jgi:hypothetical protein